jgi:RibD C-terminal domain
MPAGREQPAVRRRPPGRHRRRDAAACHRRGSRNDLVDQYRLWIFPLVIGSDKRLFADGTIPAGLKLVDHKVSTTGVVIGTTSRRARSSPGRSRWTDRAPFTTMAVKARGQGHATSRPQQPFQHTTRSRRRPTLVGVATQRGGQ